MLVEVNCETDFVARNDEFKEFARDIAIHVAAAAPRWVSEEDVPAEEREARARGPRPSRRTTPSRRRSSRRSTEGRLRKWLEEVVLLKQEHVHTDKHEGRTIEQLRAEISTKTGENVVIRRFARFQVGL